MKKIILLVAAICFSIPFYGQETPLEKKSNVVFGVKAGINLINTKTDQGNSSNGIGFQVGGTLNVPMSSKFSFQPELLLQVVNSKYEYNYSFGNDSTLQEVDNKNTFLQLPLHFKYNFSKKFDVELGPSIGYLIGYKNNVKTTIVQNGVTFTSERNSTETSENKLIFGANAGVNYNITDAIYTGLRYTLFISQYQSADDTLNNSLFSLSMGYKFI